MSKVTFDQIAEGLKEAAISVRHQRALTDQVTVAVNALQLIALGDPDAPVIAKEALLRIVDLIPPKSEAS